MARKRNEVRSIISTEGGAVPPVTHHRSVRVSVTPPAVSEPVSEPVAAAPVSAPPDPQPAVAEEAVAAPAISEQEEIANLAYSYWEARGRQGGSPEEDWARAEGEVRSRRHVSVE